MAEVMTHKHSCFAERILKSERTHGRENKCYYCFQISSRPEDGHADYAEALELGRALAAAGFTVCTGGYGGVMEAVSRGARESGGRVLAVTSSFFPVPRQPLGE